MKKETPQDQQETSKPTSDVMNIVYVVSFKGWEGEYILKICKTEKGAKYFISNEYNGVHEPDELSISRWAVTHYS